MCFISMPQKGFEIEFLIRYQLRKHKLKSCKTLKILNRCF